MFNINLHVVSEASRWYQKIWGASTDVSAQTKKAQEVTRKWQNSLTPLGYDTEVEVSKINNEKIDVIDRSRRIAYELKVSGKNIEHELFKDIYKVMTYNLYNQRENITDLVFISEHKAINKMENKLDKKYRNLLKEKHNLNLYLLPLFHEKAISHLMINPPEQWGGRGDPYLWLELVNKLSNKKIPNSIKNLEEIVKKEINEIIGEKMKLGKDVYVEAFAHGGMSSGSVSSEYWLTKGIPIIVKSFDNYVKLKS